MFIPLHDDAPPLRHIARPVATWALILANVAVWAAGAVGALGDLARLDTALGVIPAVLFGHAQLSPELAIAPLWATFATSMFLHAGIWHLAGNMLFLFVFGDNVEDALGTLRFLVFYLLCGLAGALAHAFAAPTSESPLIGASSAVSGVIASYLLLHPQVRVLGLVFNWLPVRIAAIWLIGAWIAFQIGSALFGGRAEVGWWAHVGGLVAGAALTPLLARRGTPIPGRAAGAARVDSP